VDFSQVYNTYKSELDRVETVLLESVQSRNHKLGQAATQLLLAGGKRIRPLFALLCSKLGDGSRQSVFELAAAVEMVHMATLVHDDVIDDASLRRGQPTVRAQFGNRPAMYTGDFLFAKSIQLLGRMQNATVHIEMSQAMVRVCEGEIEQIRDFYNWGQTLRNYLRRVERKTALLIAVSCSLGAQIANAPESTIGVLRRFGHATGMAFQIVDDVLDYVGDERVVGKPVGSDMLQGNVTLPALYAATLSTHASELQSLIRREMSSTDVARAVELIRSTDAIEQARKLARQYMEKGMSALERLPDTAVRSELAVVAEFVNQRVY
jgi:heptaprenyl diphosphate synthase